MAPPQTSDWLTDAMIRAALGRDQHERQERQL